MENIKVTLPMSGYTAEIKGYIDRLTFKDYKALAYKNAVFGAESEEITIKLEDLSNGNELLLQRLLVALYDKEGNKLEPAYDKLNELDFKDGELIEAELQKMVKKIEDPVQKKTGSEHVSHTVKV